MSENVTTKQREYLKKIHNLAPVSRYEFGNKLKSHLRGMAKVAARSGISKIFSTLENKGLIEVVNSPDTLLRDSRDEQFALTKKGKELINKTSE